MKHQTKALFICLSISLLSGCNMELPLIGNVQDQMVQALDTLENIASPLKGVIRPIKQQLFPHKALHHRRTAMDPSSAGDSETDEVTPSATPTPIPPPPTFSNQQQVRENIAFDHWRSLGIQHIYEAQTAEAIACFKKAAAMRPNDKYIQDWIFAAENPVSAPPSESYTQQVPGALPSLPTR